MRLTIEPDCPLIDLSGADLPVPPLSLVVWNDAEMPDNVLLDVGLHTPSGLLRLCQARESALNFGLQLSSTEAVMLAGALMVAAGEGKSVVTVPAAEPCQVP